MKKSLLLKRIFVLLSVLFVSWQIGSGQALLIENFDYPNGSLLTANGWTAHSGAGTNAIDVIVPGLSFTDYPSSGIGGAAQVDNSGEDVNKSFASQTSGSVYVAFLINVTSSTVAGDYFFHVIESPTSTYFKGRVWIKQGTSASKFYIGIAKTGTTPAVAYSASEYDVATTYLLVLKYQINTGSSTDDVVTLYVNPTPLSSEPASPTVTASDNTTTDAASITCVALRQGGSSTCPKLVVDGIRVATDWTDATSDVYAPVATFDPANTATDVAINVTPTITFDEPVRKTNGNALENSDLATLITFKKTNPGGADVPFTATIDAAKKVITITPSSSLDNSQLYYLALGAVEDPCGNETSLQSITFTTIAAAAPSVTITYPVGGETFYAGGSSNVTWISANITNVMIEAYVESTSRTWKWETITSSTPAAAGTYALPIPADALYGTEFKIRISDASNSSVNSTSGDFTCITVATSLTDLKNRTILNDYVKLSSEVVMTFKRATGNTKYVQDANAGLMIYDNAGILTTILANGDKFKDLEGKIDFYNGVRELIPSKSTVTVTSSGNTVTPPEMTLTDYNTNYLNYESMLVKLTDVTFPAADGSATFGSSANTSLTDGANTITFRTFATGESDIVGSIIPTNHIKMTCLAGFYNTTVQVYSRTLADFDILTVIEKTSAGDKIQVYPVPATSELNIRNLANIRSIEIFDITGKVISTINTSSEEMIRIPIANLKRGMYMLRFNTSEGRVIKRFVKD